MIQGASQPCFHPSTGTRHHGDDSEGREGLQDPCPARGQTPKGQNPTPVPTRSSSGARVTTQTTLSLAQSITTDLTGVCRGDWGWRARRQAAEPPTVVQVVPGAGRPAGRASGAEINLCPPCPGRCPGLGPPAHSEKRPFLICTRNQGFVSPGSGFKFKTKNMMSSQIHT